MQINSFFKVKFVILLLSLYPYIGFCKKDFNSSGNKTIQKSDNTDSVFFGLTAYPYMINSKLSTGSVAIGPTLIIDISTKYSFQIGLLADLKRYTYYQPNHWHNDTLNGTNLFFTILLNYNYFNERKYNCYLTTGFIWGGKYYINEWNQTKQTNGLNVIVGAGIMYNVAKYLYFKPSITLRYSEKVLFPGLLINFLIPIKISQH